MSTVGVPGARPVTLAIVASTGAAVEAAAAGARRALSADPSSRALLVVPAGSAVPVADPDLETVVASGSLPAGVDVARAVRATRDAPVRVAARLVRDGRADVVLSVGSVAAAVAAAAFTFRLVPGVTRPVVGAVLPGSTVLLDTGGSRTAAYDVHALAGAALARVAGVSAEPRIAVLGGGVDPHDDAREAAAALDGLPLDGLSLDGAAPDGAAPDAVATVDGADVAAGRAPGVVVTDGRTGAVLLAALTARSQPVPQVVLGLDAAALALGGTPGPDDVARAVAEAAALTRRALVAAVADAVAPLVVRRRAAAGLTGAPR